MSDELIDTGSQNITGYRKQTVDAKDLINEIKSMERNVASLWKEVRAHDVPTDPRELAMARTHFEDAFMHFCRAVFQPVDPFEGD